MFDEAWQLLAPQGQNTLNVEWGTTSCEHREALAIEWNEGVSEYWLGLKVLNANWPVTNVWARPARGGSWVKFASREWNVFTKDGGGLPRNVDIYVQCQGQRNVVLENVLIQSKTTIMAPQNC